MLKTFFEIGTDQTLFDGLEIAEETALCNQHMEKYPVISISLKDVEGEEAKSAYGRGIRGSTHSLRQLETLNAVTL